MTSISEVDLNRLAQKFHDVAGIGLAGVHDKPKIIAGLRAVFEQVGVQVTPDAPILGGHGVDDLASQLGRHLTIFQLAAGHDVPTPVLANLVAIIHHVSGALRTLLNEAEPGTTVRVDPRLNEGMEKAYRDVFAGAGQVPDAIPDDWR